MFWVWAEWRTVRIIFNFFLRKHKFLRNEEESGNGNVISLRNLWLWPFRVPPNRVGLYSRNALEWQFFDFKQFQLIHISVIFSVALGYQPSSYVIDRKYQVATINKIFSWGFSVWFGFVGFFFFNKKSVVFFFNKKSVVFFFSIKNLLFFFFLKVLGFPTVIEGYYLIPWRK